MPIVAEETNNELSPTERLKCSANHRKQGLK